MLTLCLKIVQFSQLFIFNGTFCHRIPCPTSRQSQVHVHLLPRNGMAILDFVNASKDLLKICLSSAISYPKDQGGKTQQIRSIFFLNNMSKLESYYCVIRNAFRLFAEMLIGIKKERQNKMEGRKKEKPQTVLVEVIKCKIYMLEKKTASTKCRSREYQSWQAFRLQDSSLISQVWTVCSERLNNPPEVIWQAMAVPGLGKIRSQFLNVYYVKGFKNVISQNYGLNCNPAPPICMLTS